MRVIICGSRTFSDYPALCRHCDAILRNQTDIEVVVGCARGGDELAERYAKERGYRIKRFPADWNKYNTAAGPIRNGEMGDYAEGIIAFWDCQSKGTLDMMKQAAARGLKGRVIMRGMVLGLEEMKMFPAK